MKECDCNNCGYCEINYYMSINQIMLELAQRQFVKALNESLFKEENGYD